MKMAEFKEAVQALLDGKAGGDPVIDFVVEKYRAARLEFAQAATELQKVERTAASLRTQATRAEGKVSGYARDLEQLLGLEEDDGGRRAERGDGAGRGNSAGDGERPAADA